MAVYNSKKEGELRSNSSLINMTILSPEHSGKRTHAIDRITVHMVAGPLIAANIAACFPKGRRASCNYAIGKDKKIALVVDEGNRSWCSSSSANDDRAVTIECANESPKPYALCTGVYDILIALCVDICKRNGKRKLIWIPDKDKALAYQLKSDEMLLTKHNWFAATSCPGTWVEDHLADLAEKVTTMICGVTQLYRVKKSWLDKDQKGAFKILEYAKQCADGYPGYTVYDEYGRAVYTSGKGYLTKGDSGSEVREMQKLLIACRYSCGKAGADGEFGANTLKALTLFQEENGQIVDGKYKSTDKEALTEFLRIVNLYAKKPVA